MQCHFPVLHYWWVEVISWWCKDHLEFRKNLWMSLHRDTAIGVAKTFLKYLEGCIVMRRQHRVKWPGIPAGIIALVIDWFVTKLEQTFQFSRLFFQASASWDSTLRVWDTQSGDLLHVLEGHTGWVQVQLLICGDLWFSSLCSLQSYGATLQMSTLS